MKRIPHSIIDTAFFILITGVMISGMAAVVIHDVHVQEARDAKCAKDDITVIEVRPNPKPLGTLSFRRSHAMIVGFRSDKGELFQLRVRAEVAAQRQVGQRYDRLACDIADIGGYQAFK